MRLSNDWLLMCGLLAAAGVVMVALSACTAGHHGPQGIPASAGSSDTDDGGTDTGEPSGAGNAATLTGRAKYEGAASGEYSSGELTAALRYFSATVSLIADFGDNTIGGLLSDGRDTATDEEIFAGLRLEPAAIPADDTESFSDGVIGVVDGNLFTGSWSGQFTGEETSSAGSRSSVGGTFQAERPDDPSASITGTFSGDYGGYTSRTTGAFNDLSPALRSRLALGITAAAGNDVVSTADVDGPAGLDTAGVAWNAGVTQSAHDPLDPYARVGPNWAINARYEDDALVFDRTNLAPSPRVTLTTSDEPEAPGYRGAMSLAGWLDWSGVEYFQVDASTNRNYSILVADIEDNDDPDYMVGGIWTSVPGIDDPTETARLPFTAAAGGNDPFQGAKVETLKGHATYQGDAFGLYASRNPAPAFRYFSADVRLTADFNHNRVYGAVLDGRDTASDEVVFAALELHDAGVRTDGPAFFRGRLGGAVGSRHMSGDWGGQFLGNGVSAADAPGSVVGTFGASTDDSGDSLVGIFGAHEDLTRRLSGHGLEAGTFTVEPGGSAAHGNLEMYCPADGAACTVTAGADRTVFQDRNGGDPGFVFRLPDAPVVELDGVVHVGADVAPPAGRACTAGGTRHGASVSSGSVQDGVGRGSRRLVFAPACEHGLGGPSDLHGPAGGPGGGGDQRRVPRIHRARRAVDQRSLALREQGPVQQRPRYRARGGPGRSGRGDPRRLHAVGGLEQSGKGCRRFAVVPAGRPSLRPRRAAAGGPGTTGGTHLDRQR